MMLPKRLIPMEAVVVTAARPEPAADRCFAFAGLEGRWALTAGDTGGQLAAAEFKAVPQRRLITPVHRHAVEDEYVGVLDGLLTVLVGDRLSRLAPGQWLRKPRGVWHTAWNAGPAPCSFMELSLPAGLEAFFIAAAAQHDPEELEHLAALHGIDLDLDSVADLCARHGLRFPGL